jgi:sulfoxide reductase heme-binding subunit YedZ
MTHDLISAAWYLARGSGLSSLVLFSIVVALGIGSRSGRPLFGLPRFAVQAVHSTAALTAVGFLAVHVVALLFDPYAQLKLLDLVVPFTGAYRPLWLGLGTLALDLMLAVVVTSLLRERLGARAWKAVHWAAYAAWPVAVLHGLGTGTDASALWMQATTAACVVLVGAAATWRLAPGFGRPVSRPAVPAAPAARRKEFVR